MGKQFSLGGATIGIATAAGGPKSGVLGAPCDLPFASIIWHCGADFALNGAHRKADDGPPHTKASRPAISIANQKFICTIPCTPNVETTKRKEDLMSKL